MSKLTFKTEPWEHQLRAVEYFMGRDTAALYTKPGSGKTKIMLDTVINKGLKRVLIVAPKKAAESVWPKEIKKHTHIPEENVLCLTGKSTADKVSFLKKSLLKPKYDGPVLIVCNYDAVWRKELRNELVKKYIGLDCVICDESHKIKSPGGKISMALFYVGKRVRCRYLVTGTPFADKPTDIYAQYRFLDSSIFGTNFSLFQSEYVNIDPVLSARVGHPIPDKNMPYKNLDKLHDKVYSCAFTMDSVVKLPKTRRKIVEFQLDRDTEDMYLELNREGIVQVEEEFYIETDNVLSKKSAQQRMLSGYVKATNLYDEEAMFKVDSKRAQTLCRIMKEIGSDEKIVIFYKYSMDKKAIQKVCKKLGRTLCEISGKCNQINLWQKGQADTVMVQYNAGAEGIELTESCNMIYYTLHHSLGLYEQSLKRIHRPGQTRKCTYYHIVAHSDRIRTVDEEIIECLRLKKNYVDEVEAGTYK